MVFPNFCLNIRQGKTQCLPELNGAHDPVALAYKVEALRTQSNKRSRTIFPCRRHHWSRTVSNSPPAQTPFYLTQERQKQVICFPRKGPTWQGKGFSHALEGQQETHSFPREWWMQHQGHQELPVSPAASSTPCTAASGHQPAGTQGMLGILVTL